MNIQCYPGHMAKARRMLESNLKLIDVVVEMVDARAPRATRNPDFDDLFAQKDRLIILNKSDLASDSATQKWIESFKARGIASMPFVATNAAKRKAAVALVQQAAAEKVARLRQKGVEKTVRAMIVGIPNVGKSTFINQLAGASKAQVGDRPGVTKGKQWVRISPYLELMDTPGLLWPKLEDELLARHLAFIGSINDDIMDMEQLATYLLQELMALEPEQLIKRYKKLHRDMAADEMLHGVCESRGFVMSGGEPDLERAARIVLDEYRAGKICRATLELP